MITKTNVYFRRSKNSYFSKRFKMVQMLSSKVFSVEKLFSSDNIECSFIMFDFFFDILKILGEYGGDTCRAKRRQVNLIIKSLIHFWLMVWEIFYFRFDQIWKNIVRYWMFLTLWTWWNRKAGTCVRQAGFRICSDSR